MDFRAPAAQCEPIDGQPYDQVPTMRPRATPAWKVEEPVYFGTERGPARIVHRGTCHTSRALARPVTIEGRVPAALDAVRRGTPFADPAHTEVLRDLVTLHYVRSYQYRRVHTEAFERARASINRKLARKLPHQLARESFRETGLHLAGRNALAAYQR